jgi:hypothetical protein
VQKRVDNVAADNRGKTQETVKLVNLALGGAYTRSAQVQGNGSSKKAFDGNYSTGQQAYWYSGDTQLPAWIRVAFPRPSRVHAIRLLIPQGTERFPLGGEPLDYAILVEQRGREVTAIQVRGGKYSVATSVPNKDGKGTKFVTLKFAAPVTTTSVRLFVTRTSGKNVGPVIFEMEVLGIKPQ